MCSMILPLTVIFHVIVLSRSNFIVHTDECKIPFFPAFSKEANATFVPQEYISCWGSDLLTFTTVKNNKAYLHLKEENEIYHKSEEPLKCCYSYVVRNGSEEEPDVGISMSDCVYFNATVELEVPTVIVKCEDDTETVVYENVHNPIIITEEVQTKLKEQPLINKRNSPISVLLVVIDSVSRLNFKRTMPQTRKFLLQNNFAEFIAYNKVDDNTFPNCMALLSGLNLKQTYSQCMPREVGKLDKCPMVWYDFRDLGYVTAYAEDWADISTFNYLKKGFRNPPTDYYFKPYVEAAETLNVTTENNMLYCTGPETEGERILNLARDFSIAFKGKPSFGIFWMNTFSHNYINAPIGMDEKVAHFFKELRTHGILKENVVMVLSDHGIRFGKFRQSIQGWFEERLPINFISLPKWFKEKYPTLYGNFLDNANKLVSTYDLYMTLQDMLKMSVSSYNVSSSPACPRCQSLFSNITRHRSCRDAGIPEAWCTCIGKFVTEDERLNEETIDKAAELALKEIPKLEFEEPFSISVKKVLSSAVNVNRLRESYLLLVVETNTAAIYQILFRIRGNPVDFVRVVRAIRLY